MIPIKTIADKANAEITAGSLTDLEYTQLTGSDVFLDRAIPKVVANVASLPAAANNEGIIYYVSNEAVYYFSDGTNWRNDFTSDLTTAANLNYAWGGNNYGQLGDNTVFANKSSPVTVVGGITNWVRVNAGGNHTLAITSNGLAYAWGRNNSGQLGDDTTSNRASPVPVVGGITNWSQLLGGGTHSLGLTSTGIAYAWGYNGSGRLGDNTTSSRLSPVTVVGGITNWKTLSAGSQHSLGLTLTGIAYGWGRNANGQLGQGGIGDISSPVTVVGGITSWSQVLGGAYHSLGLTSASIAYAWGYNTSGQLGDNTTVAKSSPVTVVGGITNWSQISASNAADHSLGINSIGIAYAWGNNGSGRLGDNTTSNRSSPVTVVGGITNWNQLIGGKLHSLGLTSASIVYAWGGNAFRQLGDTTSTARSSPVTVVGGITNWSQISAGNYHSLGLTISYNKGFV